MRRTSVFQRFLTEYVKTAPFTSIGLEARLAYVKRTKSNLQLCYKSTNQLVKTTQITQGVLCARTAPLFLYNSCYLESSLSMSFAVVSGRLLELVSESIVILKENTKHLNLKHFLNF